MADHNYHAASGSAAENLFIDIFADTFGAEKAGMLCTQYHFMIYTITIALLIFY